MPFLSLAGEGEGAVYPPDPRRRHGDVTVKPIIGGVREKFT